MVVIIDLGWAKSGVNGSCTVLSVCDCVLYVQVCVCVNIYLCVCVCDCASASVFYQTLDSRAEFVIPPF